MELFINKIIVWRNEDKCNMNFSFENDWEQLIDSWRKWIHWWMWIHHVSMVYTLIRCIWLHDVGNQGSHHHVSRYMMYVDDGSMMDVDTSCMKSMDLYMMYPHPSWIHRRDTSCNQIHRIRVYTIGSVWKYYFYKPKLFATS